VERSNSPFIDIDDGIVLDKVTIAGQDKRRLYKQNRTAQGMVELKRSKGFKDMGKEGRCDRDMTFALYGEDIAIRHELQPGRNFRKSHHLN
jgi:hypothetical protein